MMVKSSFKWQDYLVFAVILITSITIGIVNVLKKRSSGTITEYLLANRKLKWMPVGLSILVTFQSAILFIGVPAEVYTYGTSYLLFHIGMSVSVLISAFIFVPLLFPLKLTSVYEYLERRFQSKIVRIIGCSLGMMNMCLYMGVVLFAPATAIEAVSDIPVWLSILVIGITATLYTTIGGIKAVIWTDVFQFCVMFAGLLTVIIQGCLREGGLSKIWNVAEQGDRIDFGSLDADPRVRHSVWSLLIGGTFTWLANIGVNQSNVQRFSSVPNLQAAKAAVLVSMPGFVVFGCLASLVGLIVYSYFVELICDPLAAGVVHNPNQLVPLYVANAFRNSPGFAGLFVSSIVAASLSTVSSSINSLGAMMWEDILKWKFDSVTLKASTKIVKFFVLIFGCVAVLVAFLALQLGGPATQIALGFFGASGGPLLGIFLLGGLCSRANWLGTSVGAIVSLTVCLWLAIGKYSIPQSKPLPGPSDNTSCSIFTMDEVIELNLTVTLSNSTTAINIVLEQNQTVINTNNVADAGLLHHFYSISYLWYSTIGVSIVFIVGITVSLATDKILTIDRKIDSNLLITRTTLCSSRRKSLDIYTSNHAEEMYNTNQKGGDFKSKALVVVDNLQLDTHKQSFVNENDSCTALLSTSFRT